MIGPIQHRHYDQILKINSEFVHWLSPLDEAGLEGLLGLADYARQIDDAQAVLIGYAHDVDYPDHKNLDWLRPRVDNFFYIDRIIVDASAQGKGYARQLYEDFERVALNRGHDCLTCEVNTKPDNPGSHRFHESLGFVAIGDVDYPAFDASLRYYKKEIG